MPYLHWRTKDPASREHRLKEHYDDSNHSSHVRRTLDQYYYRTLPDTLIRDTTQTVLHFQTINNLETKVIIMVDQLWLWVVKNTGSGVDTVISCFLATDRD
jgi:hypothetical protein